MKTELMLIKYSQKLSGYPNAFVNLPCTWVWFGSFVEAFVKGLVGVAFISRKKGTECRLSLQTLKMSTTFVK